MQPDEPDASFVVFMFSSIFALVAISWLVQTAVGVEEDSRPWEIRCKVGCPEDIYVDVPVFAPIRIDAAKNDLSYKEQEEAFLDGLCEPEDQVRVNAGVHTLCRPATIRDKLHVPPQYIEAVRLVLPPGDCYGCLNRNWIQEVYCKLPMPKNIADEFGSNWMHDRGGYQEMGKTRMGYYRRSDCKSCNGYSCTLALCPYVWVDSISSCPY